MPELPDVQVYKQYLDATSLHSEIDKVYFPDQSLLKASVQTFRKYLEDKKLKSSKRLGKNLFVEISSGKWLVLHFGMTGYLEYYKNQDVPKYSKMLIHFKNGYHLSFINKRKLGKIEIADSVELYCKEHNIGKDALDFAEKEFVNMLDSKSGSIKGVLMNQKNIAGIGNIYADEILYQTKIHPKTPAAKLDESERKQLFRKMKHILKVAIENGAEPSQLPNSYLVGHRKEGASCGKCKGQISKIKIGGRSTYFCETCQKQK